MSLCSNPGASKDEIAAMLESAIGQLEATDRMQPESRDGMIALIRAKLEEVRQRASGQLSRAERPWHRPAVDAPYAMLEQLEPGIARLLARNPSAFTYFGTQTYLVGTDEVVVIDPGPAIPDHIEAIVAAIAGRPVAAIACTHTHRDHSPAAAPLAERRGRRSSAARRWRWRASARAPTRRSTATMRPTGCSATARRSRSTARR